MRAARLAPAFELGCYAPRSSCLSRDGKGRTALARTTRIATTSWGPSVLAVGRDHPRSANTLAHGGRLRVRVNPSVGAARPRLLLWTTTHSRKQRGDWEAGPADRRIQGARAGVRRRPFAYADPPLARGLDGQLRKHTDRDRDVARAIVGGRTDWQTKTIVHGSVCATAAALVDRRRTPALDCALRGGRNRGRRRRARESTHDIDAGA